MKTNWDYTELAQAYVSRADYADEAIDALLRLAAAVRGARCCDVGAGVAHLTRALLRRGLEVAAVEPNAAMRALGVERTREFPAVRWFEGVGEATGRPAGAYALVTFGSSFNVCDRALALAESHRILAPAGWFACLWNHRDLDDPLQREIEAAIKARVPGYGYGTRREDQTAVIAASGLFEPAHQIEGTVLHEQRVADCITAWESHATLQRQAGERFGEVVDAIRALLAGRDTIRVPYTTRVWAARRRG